ncbi:MAG: monooxygenase [Gemmobacter sp.]
MAITLVQVDFPHPGPWGDEMAAALEGLAQSIAQEPGFLFKYWTEDRASGRAGGIYGFASRTEAEAYLAMHTRRLEGFGYAEIRGLVMDVNEPLSRIDKAPVL